MPEELDRENWLAERRSYIGASDACAVLGMSRWKTPIELWAEKTGKDIPEDISDKLHIRIGNKSEQMVAELFEEETGKKVRRANQLRTHKIHPFLKTNLDRIIEGTDEILECKTANGWKSKEWDGDEIPQEYIIQVMHQLLVTGKKIGWIACLIGGNEKFVYKKIERNEVQLEDLERNLVAFWKDCVVPGVMPAVITKNDGDILAKLFDQEEEEGEPIVLTDEANQLVESLQGYESDKKGLEGQIDQTKNELKVLLKDKMVGVTNLYKISWKNQTAKRIDSKKLKEEKPEIAEAYSKSSTSRVLRVGKVKPPKVKKEKKTKAVA